MEPAPCALAPDLFFTASRPPEELRRVCQRCPIRADCLDTALELERGQPTRNRHGLWGGLSPSERAELDTRRAA